MFIILDAKRAFSDSHVNIKLLESVSKAIDPFQKKFYAFMCSWNKEGMVDDIMKGFK